MRTALAASLVACFAIPAMGSSTHLVPTASASAIEDRAPIGSLGGGSGVGGPCEGVAGFFCQPGLTCVIITGGELCNAVDLGGICFQVLLTRRRFAVATE